MIGLIERRKRFEVLAHLPEGKIVAVVAILDDDLMSKSFAVEPAWRQALKSAGYYRTASGITATFLLSKQQRLRKYGLGAVCEATQLFNQIPGQEQMCDKMSVIKLLRAASHRLHLNLDEFSLFVCHLLLHDTEKID